MTTEIKGFERTFVCGATTLAAKQYRIMKQHTDGTLIIAAAGTDKLVGVLKNKPAVGKAALVQFLGTCKVISGGVINPGDFVTSDGNGAAIATTTNKNVALGMYIGTAAAASGDIIEVMLGIHTMSV